jgi:tripartite-type tricarboxylate transporter receptor subunit TctC
LPISPGSSTSPSRSEARVNAPTWWSVAAPAGTPAAIVEQLNRAINSTLRDPALRQKLEGLGVAPVGSSTDSMQKRIAKELSDWRPVVDKSSFTVP